MLVQPKVGVAIEPWPIFTFSAFGSHPDRLLLIAKVKQSAMPTTLKSEVILVKTKQKHSCQPSWDSRMDIRDKSASKTNKKSELSAAGGFIFKIRAN